MLQGVQSVESLSGFIRSGRERSKILFCPIMLINREIKPNQGRHGQRRCHVEICVHLTGPLYIRPSASHETQKQWADGGDVKNAISEGGLCFQWRKED